MLYRSTRQFNKLVAFLASIWSLSRWMGMPPAQPVNPATRRSWLAPAAGRLGSYCRGIMLRQVILGGGRLGLLLLTSSALGQSFGTQTTFTAGDGPISVAVEDVNGDGKPDIVTANASSDNVTVRLGTGTGSFGAATPFAVGDQPLSVAVGDVNGDGKPDIITANQISDNVSVLLGTGTGSFGSATNFAVGDSPRSVAVGDVNGDGKPDIITANLFSDNVTVLLGTGTGSFGAVTNFAVGIDPYSVVLVDVNGDGKADLVTANAGSDNVSVLLGTGSGSFGSVTNFAVDAGPRSVAVEDVNGDGKPDIITANFNSNTVSVLLGTGSGSFGSATPFAVGTAPLSVAVEDVNGDGKADIITANRLTDNVSVRLGTGSGSFGAVTNFAVGDQPQSVAVVDVNGDGKADLIAANLRSDNVSVLLNTQVTAGYGSCFAHTPFAVGDQPFSVAVIDVNGDGKADLITANASSDNVSVRLGTGSGSFGSATPFAVGDQPQSVAVGDVNGDGKADLITANFSSDNVTVRLGTGSGSFGAATPFAVGDAPVSVVLEDVNGDGKADLITANFSSDNVTVRLGTGTGSFGAVTNFAVGDGPQSVVLGDVNGDGKPDIVTANQISNTVTVLLGTGSGSFGSATLFAVGAGPVSVAVADVNGDGKPDLIAANFSSDNVTVRLGTGTGSFGSATPFAVGDGPRSVVLGDVNGDGKADLITANFNSNTVSVLLGTGTGSFGAVTNFAVGIAPQSVAVEDVNGDGKADLITANALGDNVSVLLNQQAVAITAQPVAGSAVCAGGTVTAQVSVSGTGSLSYQWYKGPTAVSGQTSATLTLTNVQPADQGSYQVVVTGCNSVTSTAFSLTVTPFSSESQALADLFNSTNGPSWTNKTNWLTGCDVCSWQGVTCTNGRVTGLNLIGNNLSGTLPASLSALTSLQSLELGANQLTGGIPTGISSLTALQTLNLSRTQLGGTIPASLGQLTRLQNLLLNESALTGPLPASLGTLTQLQNLQLYANQLSGCFPGNYTALCGRAQISFTNNPGLPGGGDFGAYCSTGSGSELVVSQYPQSGSACVGSTFSFSVVARGAGSYQWYKEGQPLAESGPVLTISPVSASDAGTYQVYINYGCRPGAVQSDFVTLTVGPSGPDYQPLADLYNSTNGPGWTNKTNWLTGCDVCTWQGVTCTNGRVTGLDLTSNNLRGTLPASLSALTSLQSLLLGTNQLTGTIPASLGTLPNLQTLILFQNSLTGVIPASLGTRTTLQVLNLSANQLEGAIPDQLGNLTQLRALNLGNNRLMGTLPNSLSALTGVQAFDLSRNQLTGSIPAGYGALQNTIILNINNNQLSGCFPTSLTALCAYGAVIERIAMPVSLRGARQLAMGGGTNDKVNVTNNAGLPGGGDFDSFCANDAGRCNTAPVATANTSQTATVGRAFSYTVSAFTDAETPNSLTYSALLDPATSGLTFDAATRVISGTPSQPGPVSVTITATDPGGLSASTSFSISVGPRIVSSTPLRVTLTASPQTLLTTGATVLRATASGGNVGAPPAGYTYRFSGPGDFAASQANEVTVTNLSAGVQTFTVVVADASTPTSQTTSATVSVTVTEANTAPTVATAIPPQSATVGQAFSYVIPANTFTDGQTPNSLTLSVSGLPQGLSFTAPATISGTLSVSGTSTVTITATDPGGLSANTSFVLTVRPAPVVVTPLALTLTASPATLPTSGSTTLSATVSGGAAPYRYSFIGPGTITQSTTSNTARVTNLPAGVQTFTVVVNDATTPTGQTITRTVSVTVNAPATSTALRVLHQDADNSPANNAIKPNLQIDNTGTAPIDYSQLTLRYWLTVEQFAPLTNLQVYYAQLGTDKVKMTYVALDKPRQGAFGYVEYRFEGAAGSLVAGTSSGPIQSGIAKQDYTAFNEADDYSFANNRNLTANSRITAYLGGQLVWGTEPAEVAGQRIVKAYTENKNGASTNTISTYLQVRNEGNVAVSYSDLKVRYYFTSEGNQPLNFYLDYAVLGNTKITSQFVRLSPALNQADTYLELSFNPSLGTFSPGSSTGNIQYRIAKQDWSNFTQSNDHSYQNGTQPLTENGRVVIYVGGQRVWGTEPGAGARIGARVGTEEYDASLRVTVLGNPVQGATATVEVRGAEGQPLRLQLTDLSGRLVSQQVVEQAGAVERHTIGLGTQPAGLLLLQVSTPTQKRTVKLIKAE